MATLDFEKQTFVDFRDHAFAEDGWHGFRWVDLKAFGFHTGDRDPELLAALVGHEQFRDDYAGGGVEPDGTRHGPYWLSSVTPDTFRQVTTTVALHVLRHWALQHGPVPPSLDRCLTATLYRTVAAAARCYQLDGLGRKSFHDWGGVHTQFHEFVTIDTTHTRLTLLVAADD